MDVYLDTNALSVLFDPNGPISSLRSKLRDAAAAGRINVVSARPLLDELSGIASGRRQAYDEIVSFLWRVSDGHLLRTTPDLARREISLGGRLGNERFENRETRRALRRECLTIKFVREAADYARGKTVEFKSDEELRRQQVRSEFHDKFSRSPTKISRDWWSAAETLIGQWVRDSFAGEPTSYGLTTDSTLWPDPRNVPTVWNMFAYKMARMHLNIGENRRIDGSDFYDAHHYCAASYADVLVTDDGPFRDTCAMIDSTTFRVLTVAEFQRDLDRL